METTSQEQAPPRCQCQQQFGNALPLLLVALAVVMALEHWSSWRKKRKQRKPDGTAGSGSDDGSKT